MAGQQGTPFFPETSLSHRISNLVTLLSMACEDLCSGVDTLAWWIGPWACKEPLIDTLLPTLGRFVVYTESFRHALMPCTHHHGSHENLHQPLHNEERLLNNIEDAFFLAWARNWLDQTLAERIIDFDFAPELTFPGASLATHHQRRKSSQPKRLLMVNCAFPAAEEMVPASKSSLKTLKG